ncbi:hypothetical protein C7477_10730 [Phyllobacterium leguminum]|uniref:Uncharacterized protein n=1 Tax=Phyllobacterium leguminum TaxID=314237 RepID=A0A318THM0_9HYPH|nr:hypothetical protein C7477_10730 [Phyllobacterium leguminum]
MKLSMRLTMDGLIRSLRWRGIEQREKMLQPISKKDEPDDERRHGIAEGGLSRPLR